MSLLWSKYPCYAKTNLQSVKYYRSIPPIAKFTMGWAQAFGLGKSLYPWALCFSIAFELPAPVIGKFELSGAKERPSFDNPVSEMVRRLILH